MITKNIGEILSLSEKKLSLIFKTILYVDEGRGKKKSGGGVFAIQVSN